MRGYAGVALIRPKTDVNLGGVLRNCHAFGAAFVILVGHRYHKEPTDVTHAGRHLPIFSYPDLDYLLNVRPYDCELVRVEVNGAKTLPEFTHLERAIYCFGGEDQTLPLTLGERSVRIDTAHCLNLATITGIVLYDRMAKR